MEKFNDTAQLDINEMLENKRYVLLREKLSKLYPADVAELLGQLDHSQLPLVFRLLPKELAADSFVEMDEKEQQHLIYSFSDSELKDVVDELYVDEVADIVDEMPSNVVKRILKQAAPNMRRMINEVLKYPSGSAGSLMNTDYITLKKDLTVSGAIDRIRKTGVNKESVYVCYVTEPNRKLLGLINLRLLLFSYADTRVSDIMETNIISANTLDDKEQVANTFQKYNLTEMPVTDGEGRIVGIITVDDAMEVMQDEATEDIERMAAINPTEESYFKTSDFKHAKNRIFWLLILMLSAAITGTILTKYEDACAAIPALVSFIPMLMSTGGNCGSQSSTMIIRGMSVDEIKLKDFLKVIFTEFRISLVICVILAIVNGVRIWIMSGDLQIATVVSLSIICIVIISQFIGCSLPMLAKRCKLDPAVMAAPLITTIVDATSILIFFNIATRFFNL